MGAFERGIKLAFFAQLLTDNGQLYEWAGDEFAQIIVVAKGAACEACKFILIQRQNIERCVLAGKGVSD